LEHGPADFEAFTPPLHWGTVAETQNGGNVMADDARTPQRQIVSVADHPVIRLWPDGPPSSLPEVGAEISYRWIAPGGGETDMLRNVSDPSLTVFAPEPNKANGVGVIVCPGGGWRILAWEHEGVDAARWLAGRGYTAFLLKYRVMASPPDQATFAAEMARMAGRLPAEVPHVKAPRLMADLLTAPIYAEARKVAEDDGRRAVQIVRERAGKWGLDPERIGMMGFSAGAFLTVDVALAPGGPPLAFIAPIYGGETAGRTVTRSAPPLFTTIAQDDRMLLRMVEGLYADWTAADRPAELHLFAKGGHGFGMVRRGLPVDRWVDLLGDWLVDRGFS
jgi:acetyl esterase/lipase